MEDTNIPEQDLKETVVQGDRQPRVSQVQLLHQECSPPWKVVSLVKTTLRTQAQAHVILFRSDLPLAYAPLVDYYGLRFHIELHLRDAKQYGGLEDCMNVPPTGVTNAANLSLCVVNGVYRLRAALHPRGPA